MAQHHFFQDERLYLFVFLLSFYTKIDEKCYPFADINEIFKHFVKKL
ncbi:hypothetical protein B4119_3241 [Parageobacillus caldoxylosilyticus]|uniref:Uncharacterized protein n=1 Tax=Saccharococcus caldoxylosilyticus TaxID=81408 RepID=A0A150M6K6_9BACL|nr:hypothetical protein B4119_3241 [Parageobacillus caldoxylosilyticus]